MQIESTRMMRHASRIKIALKDTRTNSDRWRTFSHIHASKVNQSRTI